VALDCRLPVRLARLRGDPAGDQADLLRALGLGLGRARRDDRVDGREHDRLFRARAANPAAAGGRPDRDCSRAALDCAPADGGCYQDRGHADHGDLARRAGPGLGRRRRRQGRRGGRRRDRWLRGPAQAAARRRVSEHGAGRADHPADGGHAGRLCLDSHDSCRAGTPARDRDRGRQQGAGATGQDDPRLSASGTRDGAATRN